MYLLDKDQKHWPDYLALAVTAMDINYTINISIQKAPFEALCGENIPLPADFLLPKESFINLYAHIFASTTKLVEKVKSIYDI